jgi:hypothetical protein
VTKRERGQAIALKLPTEYFTAFLDYDFSLSDGLLLALPASCPTSRREREKHVKRERMREREERVSGRRPTDWLA